MTGAGDKGNNGQLPLAFSRRRPQTPYWPTTPLSRDQLAGALRVAEQQDEAVLAIFRGTIGPLSPSQVWQVGINAGRRWLLTSVRRSITNLTNAEVLARAEGVHAGPYGRPEHRWQLRMSRAA